MTDDFDYTGSLADSLLEQLRETRERAELMRLWARLARAETVAERARADVLRAVASARRRQEPVVECSWCGLVRGTSAWWQVALLPSDPTTATICDLCIAELEDHGLSAPTSVRPPG